MPALDGKTRSAYMWDFVYRHVFRTIPEDRGVGIRFDLDNEVSAWWQARHDEE